MVHTAVVILAYNSEKYLRQFLPPLIKLSPNAEIWVADNNSLDATKQLLETSFTGKIKTLFFDQNYGFAGGYNRALSLIDAENFILLNADVEVSKGWLEPLVDQLNLEKVGAVQPKILAFFQKDHFEYAGGSGGFLDHYGYPFCRGRIFDTCEKDTQQYNDKTEVFWATGACLAIKKDVFFEVGGFDERFFAHMEEIDLCWRLQLASYTNYVTPAAEVYHVGGGSLHKSNPQKTFLNFRNGLLLLLKNLEGKELFPVIFVRLVLDGIAGLKMLTTGGFRDFIAVIKAHFSFYSMVPYGLKKRKSIIRKSKVGRFGNAVVWQYFVAKKKTFTEIIDA